MKFEVPLLAALVATALGGQYSAPQTLPNRQTMVHLFEWKWADIAVECENFLQYYGYGAVQVSPPMEHINLVQNNDRPWWVRYQPVSYKLESRSGTEQEFIDMVTRCNKVGVRIIVDGVINHMVGVGQSGTGSGGTPFQGVDKAESFPGVPYGTKDFNDGFCDHNINNFNDPFECRKCRLVGLLDLDQDTDYVRQQIAGYLNHLISIGVAGFRIDAAKHQYPTNMAAIWSMLNNLNTDFFPPGQRPFFCQEVIDCDGSGGSSPVGGNQYLPTGRLVNFIYGGKVSNAVRKNDNFKNFGNFGPAWGMWQDDDVLVFIDNHDNQRSGGPCGPSPVTYKDHDLHIMAVAYMLAWPYGYPRVMSSYAFSFSDQGPPSSGAPNFDTQSPSFLADGTCDPNSGWVCEHRWPAIRRMALFRSTTTGAPAADIVTDDHRIAFRRGNSGFFGLNNGGSDWSAQFQTGLPPGSYCEVISGEQSGGSCTGTTVTVGGDGMASITIPTGKTFAIHLGSKLGPAPTGPFPTATANPASPGGPSPSVTPCGPTAPPAGLKRTVIFVRAPTNPGQDLFIRGGIDYSQRPGCNSNAQTDPCSISIKHQTQVPASFLSYLSWRAGDTHLDWYGAEAGQGTFQGAAAAGTPLAWSTNDPNTLGYQPLNVYGPNYWMVDLLMDCSQTLNGWFELKGFLRNGAGWEGDINQSGRCQGSAGAQAPFQAKNHIALCGYINVFAMNDNGCTITSF